MAIASSLPTGRDYKVNQSVLIAAIKEAEPLAKFLDDGAIIAEFRKRLPKGIRYENMTLIGLDVNSQDYKNFVEANPKIDMKTILITSPIPPSVDILALAKLGDTGEYVKEIQALLNSKTGSSLVVDGKYGPATANVVKMFQTTNTLPRTGTITNETLDKLRG